MNNMQVRGIATVVIWLSYLIILYISIESLGVWVTLLAFVLMMPLIVLSGGMWGMFGNESEKNDSEHDTDTEKRKRERLDNVLRDLSDEDLVRLKQRLQDGAIDDNMLYERMLGDDGEYAESYES